MIQITTTTKYCNYTEATEISPMDQYLHISTNLLHYYLCHSSLLYTLNIQAFCLMLSLSG